MTPYWHPLAVPAIGDEEVEAAVAVLRSKRTTMGEQVEAFEREFAARVGARHAVMVNSGSSADLLIACALVDGGWLHAGDEALVPAVTWPTQVWSLSFAGLRPVLVDVDPATLNVSAMTLASAIGQCAAKAASLVHLMGSPLGVGVAKVAAGLLVVEDCCEALGAEAAGRPVGGMGEAAAWSFFFSHHMTTMEGGMVTTDSSTLADLCRAMRAHGWARDQHHPEVEGDRRYAFVERGFNVRPTEVAAAIGRVQLAKLDATLAARAEAMAVVAEALAPLDWLSLPTRAPGASPAWFGVPLMVAPGAPLGRDDLAAALEAAGVETRPILAGNLHRQPVAARKHFRRVTSLRGADAVHDRGLYLGLHGSGRHAARLGATLVDVCRKVPV